MPRSRQSRPPTRNTAVPAVRSLALRLPSGHTLGAHQHDWAQVVYAVRGTLAVRATAREWVVPPLRSVWLPAGQEHGIETIGEIWMRTVYIRPDLARGAPDSIHVLEVSALLRELLLEIVRIGALHLADPTHSALTRVLLDQLGAARTLGLSLPIPTDPRASAIARRVQLSPGENTPLSVLVRGTGASVRTAERLFQNQTGLAFGRWRQQARLQLAVRLLAEGNSVTAVALDCGYDSVSAFVSMFKKAMGTTPGHYIHAAKAGTGTDAGWQ